MVVRCVLSEFVSEVRPKRDKRVKLFVATHFLKTNRFHTRPVLAGLGGSPLADNFFVGVRGVAILTISIFRRRQMTTRDRSKLLNSARD